MGARVALRPRLEINQAKNMGGSDKRPGERVGGLSSSAVSSMRPGLEIQPACQSQTAMA